MKKKVVSMLLAAVMAAAMVTGCGSSSGSGDGASDSGDASQASDADASSADSGELEDIKLTMWGAEEDQEMLQSMVDSFKEEYKDQAKSIEIDLGVCSEQDARDNVTTDVEAAADVYAFASDQIRTLYNAGALQEIQLNPDEVIEANGGADAGSVKAATIDDKLYAYPLTAGNTYFLFYNKEYISDEDAQELDKILQIAADNGKKFAFDMNSGWYNFSFFGGAGFELTLNEDGVSNSTNMNETSADGIKGTDVLQAMLDICGNKGFAAMADADFQTGVAEGTVIAGVQGVWDANLVSDTWGENYGATKLPTYTCNGNQVQMSSFAGYKLVGVNPNSDYVGWAMRLAEWISNEENQKIRFEQRGAAPTNTVVAATDEVNEDIAIAACNAQDPYSILDGCESDQYWDPAAALGAICVDGNSDGTDLQTLLDNAVAGITQSAAE